MSDKLRKYVLLLVLLPVVAFAQTGSPTLYRDMTPDDVATVLGAPTSVAQRGEKVFYIFGSGIRVEFQNGYVYTAKGVPVRTRFDENGLPILPGEKIVIEEVVFPQSDPSSLITFKPFDMEMPPHPGKQNTGVTASKDQKTVEEDEAQESQTGAKFWFYLAVGGIGLVILVRNISKRLKRIS